MVNWLKQRYLQIVVYFCVLFVQIWYGLFNTLSALTKAPDRLKPIKARYYNAMTLKQDYYRQLDDGLPREMLQELEYTFYKLQGAEQYLIARGNTASFIEAGKKARRVIWRFFNIDTGDCCPQHIRALHDYFTTCYYYLLNIQKLVYIFPGEITDEFHPFYRQYAWREIMNVAIESAKFCMDFCDKIGPEPELRPSVMELEKFVEHLTELYQFSAKLEFMVWFFTLPPINDELIVTLGQEFVENCWVGLEFILEDTFITIYVP